MADIILRKGEGRTIKKGGLWIFDNEIDKVNGSYDNGDIVNVYDFDGYPMGRGFINDNSKIRVRLLTRKIDQEIDDDFIKMRVKNAWDYRKAVMTKDDLMCTRVIFGESDFLPGIVVDKYSDVLVVEALALGIDRLKIRIVDELKRVLNEDGFHTVLMRRMRWYLQVLDLRVVWIVMNVQGSLLSMQRVYYSFNC